MMRFTDNPPAFVRFRVLPGGAEILCKGSAIAMPIFINSDDHDAVTRALEIKEALTNSIIELNQFLERAMDNQ